MNQEPDEDSILLCASDLQHAAIFDNYTELRSCVNAVAKRLAALSHPKSNLADSDVIAAPVDHVNAAVEMVSGAHPDKGTSALAAPVVPAPGAIPARIHVTEAMHRAAVKVLHRASGLDGLPQRMMDAMLAATPPQDAPVAQLSEPPVQPTTLNKS